MDFNALIAEVDAAGASDVHLKLAQPPMLRLDGSITPLAGWPVLDEAELASALDTVTASAPSKRADFDRDGELDTSYHADGLPRLRVNVYRQRGAISIAIRLIPRTVPTFSDLLMPPGVQRLAEEHRGLVLVTGATGSGKSTTLAAVVDHINRTRAQHIITIEDPIEMLHPDRQAIIDQREIGLDTQSFGQALRRALRQDPDVILIGELRDAETAETALQAAESGHLVLSTLHTVDAAETVGRMIEFFPAAKQQMVRSVMAGVLKGIVSQRLLPKVGGGRIAAVEVMVMNERIAELVRENRAEEIGDAIADGAYHHMQSLSQALIDLTLSGAIDDETAGNAAPNKHDFQIKLDHARRVRSTSSASPALRDAKPSDDEERQPPPAGADEPPLRLVAGAQSGSSAQG